MLLAILLLLASAGLQAQESYSNGMIEPLPFLYDFLDGYGTNHHKLFSSLNLSTAQTSFLIPNTLRLMAPDWKTCSLRIVGPKTSQCFLENGRPPHAWQTPPYAIFPTGRISMFEWHLPIDIVVSESSAWLAYFMLMVEHPEMRKF